MTPAHSTESNPEGTLAARSQDEALPNQITGADVAVILREHGWLLSDMYGPTEPHANREPESVAEAPISRETIYKAQKEGLHAWLADAAALLGPHAADRDCLADMLHLIFDYDAAAILQWPDTHAVLAREGAREVIRELAHRVLNCPGIDSDRFKEIINSLKEKLRFRGRLLFYPIRLVLAGRAGEGELDRVILLLDRAAPLPFSVPVKSTRERILEFCAALE